jgi:ankyrin repeat protein
VVAAACGDGDGEFVECARTICGKKGGRRLLLASNKNGDTPLHCTAAAGNAEMISCLVGLLIMANAADEIEKKSFLEAQNKCGETALNHARSGGPA